ncbi:phosphoribosylanthranilate isomerase [Qipengyuania xiapuensis]|uniref:N-(5'-phosphoribosyl)anthranilate isomerase n=2 Tax=Qipengyuania TaxID=1855416 RepID=A0A9Q3RZU1_9SPHN|nr:phosphoribosylanthranilate isomerase [Qipengyuania xiapuensis]MBY6217483.1 phosphoribosylanthranilate isomerase [Qipengyuania aquimaris]QZD92513.1 phosphoribosylanthranilate isomerase [Qipengyuania xiapuensis]
MGTQRDFTPVSTAIKICGISTPETLDAVIAARAEFVGFNFYPPSPRHVSLQDLSALAARAGSRVAKVGVFVDADDVLIGAAVEAGRLDAIQLHGEEPPARAAELKQRFGIPVWKVIPVATSADIARSADYRGAVDFMLFDAKTPKDAALPGGMGLRFDWTLLSGLDAGMPWGLAGGLTPANVADAIGRTGAPLVDTSSGVETAPGDKDPDAIAAFCSAVRKA